MQQISTASLSSTSFTRADVPTVLHSVGQKHHTSESLSQKTASNHRDGHLAILCTCHYKLEQPPSCKEPWTLKAANCDQDTRGCACKAPTSFVSPASLYGWLHQVKEDRVT